MALRSNRILFHDDLLALCDEAISETGAIPHRLPSGPFHDASEVARFGIPTIIMFVQSLHGISHNKIEDTKKEYLELAVTAFDKLADKPTRWIENPPELRCLSFCRYRSAFSASAGFTIFPP